MKPTDITYKTELDIGIAQFYLRSDGIVHCHMDLNFIIDLDDARRMMEAHREFVKGVAYPTIYTSTRMAIPSKEAREYSASAGVEFCSAEAYVTNTIAQQLAGRLYIKVDTPPVPTLMTQCYDKGIDFLLPFVSGSSK